MNSPRGWFIAAATVAAVAGAAWYTDLPSAIPVDRSSRSVDNEEPLLQTPATASHVLDAGLLRFGGRPHDVRVLRFWPYTYAGSSPGNTWTVPEIVTAYDFTLVPRDAINVDDQIRARVSAETQERCLDGGTTMELPISEEFVGHLVKRSAGVAR